MQTHEAYDERYGMAQRSAVSERADFIAKTYFHLGAAIMLFVGLTGIALQTNLAKVMIEKMMMGGQIGWLVVLGLFMGVSYIANAWAASDTSRTMQYAGLLLYVVAESIIFVPILYVAEKLGGGDGLIKTAGVITLLVFGGLTGIVFLTRKNFSFLAPALSIAGIAAFGYILCGAIFGFSMGSTFTVLMVVFASGWILYDTSNVIHNYRSDQYVAASLALFASVALLFWYILRLVMSSRD